MTAMMDWVRGTRRAYFGNAAAQRDFRVQLRGNRSMLLFGLYLLVLIGVGFFKYADIADRTISVVQAQRELRDFFTLVVMLLAGMVSIVTPGLAATAIVLERQRRSLDLVFSAPVQPRYYLIGKMIAVYRYILMLLVLSLPVTAACVVLGGASWSDVLTVYFLLSIHGLLFSAIGLLMSTVAAKPVPAVIWTYIAVAGYLSASGAFAGAAYGSSYMRAMSGSASEIPFTIGLNPFTAIYTMGTYTTMGAYHVPNYLIACLITLVAVKLCLLGAGSLLSEGRETANLRLHWLIVTALSMFGLAYWFVGSGTYSSIIASAKPTTAGGGTFSQAFAHADPRAVFLGYALFWAFAPLVLALPTLAAYGNDGASRQRANGSFAMRHSLDGTPAGALPFIFLLIVVGAIGGLTGVKVAGGALPSPWFVAYALFALGFWTLFWGVGRVASSYGMGIRSARTVVVTAFVVVVVLPLPFLSAISAETFSEPGISAWDLYLLRPVLQFASISMVQPLVYGLAFLALAFGMNAWAERNRLKLGVARA
jgi:ABC-type transport system involved in multi-copper enzyme maturation permease subunit